MFSIVMSLFARRLLRSVRSIVVMLALGLVVACLVCASPLFPATLGLAAACAAGLGLAAPGLASLADDARYLFSRAIDRRVGWLGVLVFSVASAAVIAGVGAAFWTYKGGSWDSAIARMAEAEGQSPPHDGTYVQIADDRASALLESLGYRSFTVDPTKRRRSEHPAATDPTANAPVAPGLGSLRIFILPRFVPYVISIAMLAFALGLFGRLGDVSPWDRETSRWTTLQFALRYGPLVVPLVAWLALGLSLNATYAVTWAYLHAATVLTIMMLIVVLFGWSTYRSWVLGDIR
jgi:hypothetical protein